MNKTYTKKFRRDVVKHLIVNGKTISEVANLLGISDSALMKRRTVPQTTDKHNLAISPNIVAQNFNISQLNKIWVSDITYIHVSGGWTYLSTII